MKKPSAREINRIKLHNLSLRRARSISNIQKKSKVSKSGFHGKIPTAFDISNERNRPYAVSVFESIKKTPDGGSVYVDFSNLDLFHSAAALHLVQLLDKHVGVSIHGNPPKKNVPRDIMVKIGLHERMRHGVCGQKDDQLSFNGSSRHKYVKDWNVVEGNSYDLPETYDPIERLIFDEFGDNALSELINTAVSEAVNNVMDHADVSSGMEHMKWKIFVATQPDCICFVIGDLGIGVPKSIRKQVEEPAMVKLLQLKINSRVQDGERIKFATIYKNTQTGSHRRGKGFGDMLSACKALPKSHFAVFSRRGCYISDYVGGVMSSSSVQSYDDSVQGTIIFWKIPRKCPEERHMSEIEASATLPHVKPINGVSHCGN